MASPKITDIGLQQDSIRELSYYVKGLSPKVFIGSGLHGDEAGVIPVLESTITEMFDRLPEFVFAPILSPTAVKANSRINGFDHDLNRIFDDSTISDKERDNLKDLVLAFPPFDLVITIHEDLPRQAASIYDGCSENLDSRVRNWQHKISESGFKLLNGLDTPDDPALGVEFINGYFNFDPQSDTFMETFESWCSVHASAKRNITLEVPGKLSQSEKKKFLEISLETLVV